MSSYSRRFILFGSVAAIAGCGFTPAYGPSGAANVLQNAIVVDEPKDRPSYLLTQELEQRLGRGVSARYGLSYAVEVGQGSVAISDNDVTNRFNVLGTSTYALRDLDGGMVLSSGKVGSFTSYSAFGTAVATQAAQRDAVERLMVILADQMITHLIAAAPGLPA